MMQLGTWAAVAILGPGSAAVFVWFVIDLRAMLRGTRRGAEESHTRPRA